MPRRLRDYLDNELMSATDFHDIGNGIVTYGSTYAKFLGIQNLYHEVNFIHCPTVFSPYFFQRVLAVGHLHPELVLVNISSNDLVGLMYGADVCCHSIVGFNALPLCPIWCETSGFYIRG